MNHKSLGLYAVVFAMVAIFSCGDDEVVWEDPVDIGEEYPRVGEIKSGDIVNLSNGWQRKVGFIVNRSPDSGSYVEGGVDDLLDAYLKNQIVQTYVDYIRIDMDGETYIRTVLLEEKPRADGKWEWFFDWREDWRRSAERRVVSGSLPLVNLTEWDDDSTYIDFQVRLDRKIDYNLLIYLELQTQTVEGKVHRERVFRLVPENAHRDEFPKIRVGDKGKHVKASVSILPHTEMEKIDLPVSIDIGSRNIVIPAGHTFRPYRIESPSYMMYEASDETW